MTSKLQQGEPTLIVADNGPGIDREVRPARVFERFYTGDEVSGSGLGLSIARDLTRLMGGSLRALGPARPHRVHPSSSRDRQGCRMRLA